MPRAVEIHPVPAPAPSGPTAFAHPAAPIPVGPRDETSGAPPTPGAKLAPDVPDMQVAAAIQHAGDVHDYNVALFAQVVRQLTPAGMR